MKFRSQGVLKLVLDESSKGDPLIDLRRLGFLQPVSALRNWLHGCPGFLPARSKAAHELVEAICIRKAASSRRQTTTVLTLDRSVEPRMTCQQMAEYLFSHSKELRICQKIHKT
ncbi:hypothetical protein LshimejAT787_0105170 [Lyophyllum shimeji]|uniref:Uncharacterized protein n=1 Tax=Lyophyllum shimeji TaxID=47721 RepID=A0A9P3PDV5_LYOSH|nr:hypothetical protein LshimejAT787_0105170 [Lyophyllum shimeji]